MAYYLDPHPNLPLYVTGGTAGQVLLWSVGATHGVGRYQQQQERARRKGGVKIFGGDASAAEAAVVDTGEAPLKAGEEISCVRWSPDGLRLAAVDQAGGLWLWDGPEMSRPLAQRVAFTRTAKHCVWIDGGALIAISGSNAESGAPPPTPGASGGGLMANAFSSIAANLGISASASTFTGGRGGASGAAPGEGGADASGGKRVTAPHRQASNHALLRGWQVPLPRKAFLPHTAPVTVSVQDIRLRPQSSSVLRVQLHKDETTVLTWDEASRSLLCGGPSGFLHAFDLRRPDISASISPTRAGGVTALAVDPSGMMLAAGFADGSVAVWGLPLGDDVPPIFHVPQLHSGGVFPRRVAGVTDVRWTHDWLITAGKDGRVWAFEKIW
jgi:WD40 repeat protein